MGDKSNIEWTDATWNPIRGCSRVSEGCLNCYAEKVAHRFGGEGCLDENDFYFTEDGLVSDGPEHGCLDWVIVGGESGPGARPMHPRWARSLRDQCVAAGVPFFFKQWGDLAPGAQQADYSRKGALFTRIDVAGNPSNDPTLWNASDALFYRVGKKAAGRLLDGREWNEMPA
jgi:protein gp37